MPTGLFSESSFFIVSESTTGYTFTPQSGPSRWKGPTLLKDMGKVGCIKLYKVYKQQDSTSGLLTENPDST